MTDSRETEQQAALRFGPEYREEVALPGGERLVLRPIRPDDKAKLQSGLRRLSPKSRYLRFFTAKDHLTDAELRYLTEVDGHDHFALALGELDAEGNEGDGVGTARFVRLEDEPTVAEPAIAVVDPMQGRGLGRLLMLRLIAAAEERGVEKFRCELLSDNAPVRELLTDVSPGATFPTDGPVTLADMPLPHVEPDHPPEQPAPESVPATWLRLAAERIVELRHALLARFRRE